MPLPRPTVLLFDIDGTLVSTPGAGRRALDAAFKALHGRDEACKGIRFDGMTDGLIARLGLGGLGVEVTEARIQAVLDLYIPLLAAELDACGARGCTVHVGVVQALDAARRAGAALGVGTGNIEAGARLKLQHAGLLHYFDFGGYGCDSSDRPTLIRCGAERGAARLGAKLEDCRVVVIGDTPKDVHAAREVGAECLGVGTGSFSPEELLSAGAHCAFPNLAAPGALDALLC